MQITQETAQLIDTLANAASKIGSTAGSARLNAVIVDLLDPAQLTAEERTALELAAANAETFRAQLIRLALIDDLLVTAEDEEAAALRAESAGILAPWFEQA